MMIRPYQHRDQQAVLQLLHRNTPAFFAPEEAADLRDYLATDAAHYFVLTVDGNMRGSGGFNLLEKEHIARISWDLIDPAYQGRGYGSRLLDFRLALLRKLPGPWRIEVRTSQMAFGFYTGKGFVLQQTQKDYWAPGYDLYHMLYAGETLVKT